MLPRSGGAKVYLEFTYRHPRFLATMIVAVQSVLLGFTATNCTIFAQYALHALGLEQTEFRRKLWAVVLLTTIIAIHGCFLKLGIAIQNVLGWLKVSLVLFMAFTGLWVVVFHRSEDDIANRTSLTDWDSLWSGSRWELSLLSTSIFKVTYAFAGLENVNNVLNEVKDPVRTLRSAASAALFLSFVMYMLINISYFIVIPLDEVKRSKELVAALFFEKVYGNSVGRIALSLAIAVSTVGNVMVVTFSHVCARPYTRAFFQWFANFKFRRG